MRFLSVVIALALGLSCFITTTQAQEGIITTIAGGGIGDDGPATKASFSSAPGIFLKGEDLYIADGGNNRVRKVDANGIITTVVGTGVSGFSGDGGPATEASLNSPVSVCLDSAGNLYIADSSNHRIRRVDLAGIITTIAGSGPTGFFSGGYGGDGGPATAARFSLPSRILLDATGNMYIADLFNRRIRKVDADGIITTFAGGGNPPDGLGDNGPATEASFNGPSGLALDKDGNLYIAVINDDRVRKVDTNGIITTVAGTGQSGFSGDGGPATAARLREPRAIVFDSSGNLYISEDSQVRKVGADGIITTAIVNADMGFGSFTADISLDNGDNIYVSAVGGVWKIDSNNVASRVAGTGESRFSGDGGPAALASLVEPASIFLDAIGQIYFADGATRIRKIDFDGTITTIAGNGSQGFSGDNGPAAEASLNGPSGLALDEDGNLYFVDKSNNRIRKVDSNGIITTVVGNGIEGFSGDGGPSLGASLKTASLTGLAGIYVDEQGNIYFSDAGNNRVRKVDAATGIISTVAGGGSPPDGVGDGGPATEAALFQPSSIFFDNAGAMFIANGARIRRVSLDGIITTIAGTGSSGFATGDGGPATAARLSLFLTAAMDKQGNIFLADQNNHRIRKIDTNGIITTVAGKGLSGFTGDDGPATGAKLNFPGWVAVDRTGALYIADANNRRIRKVGGRDNIPLVALASDELDFGQVTSGQSASRSLTIYNPGTGTLTGAVFVTGADSAYFNITPTALNLPARTSQEVMVGISSPDSGLAFPDTLRIESNDPDYPSLSVILTGQMGRRPGDVNGDGLVNISDVILIINMILGIESETLQAESFSAADLNQDEKVNILDVVRVINIILGRVSEKMLAQVSPALVSLVGDELFIESESEISGLQATFAVSGNESVRLTGRGSEMSLASKLEGNRLLVILYSLNGGVIRPGQGPVLEISEALALDQVIISDRNGQSIPVQIKQAVPARFSLSPNRPNPFNPSTSISYDVPQTARVTLIVYNLLGQEVIRLVDEIKSTGRYTAVWNGRNTAGLPVASGVYFYQMTASTGYVQARRMILLK